MVNRLDVSGDPTTLCFETFPAVVQQQRLAGQARQVFADEVHAETRGEQGLDVRDLVDAGVGEDSVSAGGPVRGQDALLLNMCLHCPNAHRSAVHLPRLTTARNQALSVLDLPKKERETLPRLQVIALTDYATNPTN